MSLFKTKEWWRTSCGSDETFDRHSLLSAAFFGDEKKDIIVVGSHNGYLRMYCPSSQWIEETKSPSYYKTTDTMIETRICDCIVDIKAGRFVAGSQDLRLAILSSSKLMIYNVLLADEGSEFGERCDLQIAYEHQLPKFPASLTTGPFGGVRGRDFLCVQYLDGTLFFYEQEVFAFSQTLKNRLLAEPIVYVPRYDLFVTASSSWFLECYRYQSMAEWTKSKERASGGEEISEERSGGSSLEPDWTFNIGEAVLAIEAVTLSSFEVGIVVLGERHLYCLKDNCSSVKYAKRLEYRPVCFLAYVLEPDGRLIVLVIADTSTIIIYEGSTLKWSAQLPFAPVAVLRVQLRNLEGVIVVLAEDGRLEACYLGSEPSLFVAPPLHPRGYDYAAAEKELAELRSLLKKNKESDRTTDVGVDAELMISLNVSPDLDRLEDRARTTDRRNSEQETEFVCNVSVELSSYAILRDIQVCVDLSKPLIASNEFYALPLLCERHVANIKVQLNDDSAPISSEIGVIVTYRTDSGILRVIRRSSELPLKMMLRNCPPENTSTFSTVIKSVDSLLPFSQLFPEFAGDQTQRQGSNAIGLRHVSFGRTVTVVSGNTSNRYRVQSNDGLSTTLVLGRLIDRFKDKSKRSLTANIGQNHLRLVHQGIESHFKAREEIYGITKEIGLLTSQLRNIERKILRTARERNDRSLTDTGLPFLFYSTCDSIFKLLEDLAEARLKRERTGQELRCSIKLLLLLLRLNVPDEKYALLQAAIGFEPNPSDPLDWEEIADAALSTLLKSAVKKPGTLEWKSSSWTKLGPMASSKELTKLKKRLVHAVERLDSSRESDIAEASEGNEFVAV